MEIVQNPPAIIEEAGESAKTRHQLEKMIKLANSSLFEIGDLAYKVEKNGFFEGFTTFSAYLAHLGAKTKFKVRRLRYLTRIAKVMDQVGVPRTQYEPLGVSKLREITSLDPNKIWKSPDGEEMPIRDFIKGFVEKGDSLSAEEIHTHVQTLKGFSGEDSMGWLHLYMKQIVIDKVAKPALDKARMQIGSVSKDEEGNSLDASDGAAAEVIFVSFINEEANEPA